MDNKFPADPMLDLRGLQRTVDELLASISQRSLTTASTGWLMPNMAHPSNPTSGVHIYGNGDDLAVLTPDGLVKRIPNPGSAVSNPSAMTAGSAPGSYSPSHSEALRADISEVRLVLTLLLASLENAGIIAS